jgi:hypothetical protein
VTGIEIPLYQIFELFANIRCNGQDSKKQVEPPNLSGSTCLNLNKYQSLKVNAKPISNGYNLYPSGPFSDLKRGVI